MVAALGAWLIPGAAPGLGAVLTATVAAFVVLAARPTSLTATSAILASLSHALISMLVLRDASWVLAIDVMVAVPLASLAMVPGVTWVETIWGSVAVMWGWLAAPRVLLAPLIDRLGNRRIEAPFLRGIVLGLVLVLVFGALLSSADRAFAHIATDLLTLEIEAPLLPARLLTFLGIAMAIAMLVLAGSRYVALAPLGNSAGQLVRNLPDSLADRRRLSIPEWLIPILALDLLFGAFVVLQITVLFGGRDHVLRTAGLTYAEYAREGFFQLIFVAVLTVGVIATTVVISDLRKRRDLLPARISLGALSILALVMLASAIRRLALYEQAYGLTVDRLLAYAVALWLVGVFSIIIVAGATYRWRWVPRGLVIYSTSALLVFNLMNPEGLIASRNVALYERTGRIDVFHLAGLSEDAVPALTALPAKVRACILPSYQALEVDGSWRAWNLSRSHAREALARVDDGADCAGTP
jgi:hypothetical protein